VQITIITATYNCASTIFDCLASVNTQAMPLEHVIIDGLSTDNTLALVKESSPKARTFSEPDNGIYDAMNKGLRLATGEVIGILNADDFYATPDVLAKVAKVFEDPEVDACYGDLVYVTDVQGEGKKEKGNSVKCKCLSSYLPSSFSPNFKIHRYWKTGSFDPKKFYMGWMPPHPTFFVRRRVYEQYGLFNLDLGSAADYELMLRFLFKYRINVKYIPEVLVCMRAGGASNESLTARLKANRNDRKAWEVNGLKPYSWTLALKPIRKIPQWFSKPPKREREIVK
jgi:glycosyltransferase